MTATTLILVPATKEMNDYLMRNGMEYDEFDDNRYRLFVTESFRPEDEDVDSLIIELMKHTGGDFAIEGFYDTFEDSGSTMMFRFQNQDGILKKYCSEWMSFLSASSYDYETFNDYYEDLFTEEEFEAFCEIEHYLLDSGIAVPADHIPMTECPLLI